MDARVHDCMNVLGVRVYVCVSDRRACARPRERFSWKWVCARFGRMHGHVDVFKRTSMCTAARVRVSQRTTWCVHGSDRRAAQWFVTHGLDGTHGLNFMYDWVIWPNYTDGRMQLKVKGMQLKMEACN